MMVRDDVEQRSKAILQTSIRALPADEWRRAPYLGSSSDSFWRKAEAFVPETEIPEEPLSLVPEVPHEEADLIPPFSVLRFRVERGDIPCCFVNYEAVSQAPAHWGDWVESVLDDPASVHTLTASRVLEPVRLSAKLSIRRNNNNIDFMVSRWSKDTHTFVFPWGDCGPTLQNTVVMMRLSTRGSTKPWGRRIDDVGTFFPRPYAEPVEGVLLTSFFSEDDRIVDFQTDGVAVSSSALAAFAAACPCSLPALCAEGTRSVLYRLDRVARQFGYDQGAPGPAPPLKSYAESLRRFTRAHVEELAEGYDVVVLPRNDRETFFTANGRLAWRRNLDSFVN
ncbi:hypothetical protein RHGRI_031368 [Rhododendron griersonianum]|uniref:Aminotransferase-like plant mobile domain-containing protein n=1 Tax=Rhododendron griersonianum TaxID=479676 RepID=A0AAV6I7J6_9ERIC|nr:hypothetical protein RHGRI_031368 [Rhododendron griersonianum]